MAHLMVKALPELLPHPAVGTRLAFRIVYADMQDPSTANYLARDIGSVVVGDDMPSPVRGPCIELSAPRSPGMLYALASQGSDNGSGRRPGQQRR